MAAKRAMEQVRLEDALCEYSTDGGSNWREMLNVASLQTEIAEKQTTTVSSLRTIRAYTTEPTDIGDATFELSAYLPHTRFAADMVASRQLGSSVSFRVTTLERAIYGKRASTPATAAIATTGVVTLAGDNPANFAKDDRIAPGSALKIGGKYYIIDSIDVTEAGALDGADALKVYPAPNPAVAAAAYDVVTPSLRAEFTGEVKNFGASTGQRDGAYSTQLIVTPTAALIDIWDAVVPTG